MGVSSVIKVVEESLYETRDTCVDGSVTTQRSTDSTSSSVVWVGVPRRVREQNKGTCVET